MKKLLLYYSKLCQKVDAYFQPHIKRNSVGLWVIRYWDITHWRTLKELTYEEPLTGEQTWNDIEIFFSFEATERLNSYIDDCKKAKPHQPASALNIILGSVVTLILFCIAIVFFQMIYGFIGYWMLLPLIVIGVILFEILK